MRGHGEGSLTTKRRIRKDGSVAVLHVAKVSLPDGRRVERTSMDKAVAKAHLREMLRLAGKGVEPKPRLTVAAFLGDWLSSVKPPVTRPQTWERYESIVRVHLVPGLGPLRLQTLRPSRVNEYLATEQGRTAQLCREVLRNALNAALRDRLVEYNAAELSKAVRHEAKPAVILSPDELAAFLEATADHRLHALFLLAAVTGMREAELLGLAWDDIDWDGRIHVRSQLVRLRGEWVLSEPKTRSGRRSIAIPAVAVEALQAHRLRMAAERTAEWKHWGLVFVTDKGNPLYGYAVVAEMRAKLAGIGIAKPLKLHELRHGLASMMKADGVSDQVLADYLGHSTTRLLERYAHALPSQGRLVAQKMTARLRPRRRKARA